MRKILEGRRISKLREKWYGEVERRIRDVGGANSSPKQRKRHANKVRHREKWVDNLEDKWQGG